jgi:predicted RNase H-like HicB family nuclease
VGLAWEPLNEVLAMGRITPNGRTNGWRSCVESRSNAGTGVKRELMKLTIELDREADGRWIAEVPELNIVLYGESKQDAIERAQSAAREILLDRVAHAELPPDLATATFDVAA